MLTTNNLITFLQLREGFRKHAYDDAQPHVTLTADTKIKGTITIGYGTTRYPDGSPVKWNDTVSKSEAVDYLVHFIRETIEPALENLIHVPLAGCQYDAIASCIYQYGEGEVAGWNLIRLINAGASWQEITREWLDGTVMWLGEPLFWGRRAAEIWMFLGLDWRAADNIPVLSDLIAAAELMGFDGNLPKPAPIVDADLFNDPELQIPPMKKNVVIEDPTPSTPLTQDDKTYQGYVAAVGGDENAIPYADFMAHRKVVTERDAIKAPNVDVTNEPGAMEDSETSRGIAKETSGRDDVRLAAVMSGAATAAATASTASENLSEVMENTHTMVAGVSIMQLVWLMLIFGLPLLGYGLWKMHRGKQIKNDGRAQAVRLKV